MLPRLLLCFALCFLGQELAADTIYTYTATSVSAENNLGVSIGVTASGPGFSVSRGLSGNTLTLFAEGQTVPLDFTVSVAGADGFASVDFGGITGATDFVSGSFAVTTAATFVLPRMRTVRPTRSLLKAPGY